LADRSNPYFFVKSILRLFFRLLYHQFAFTYDLVAATVSFNRWKDWVMSIIPFIEGNRILEIGHGPGHLQRFLLSRGLIAVGIDESAQMARLAKRRTGGSARLIRGVSQHLPFSDNSFDTVVATFPSEYITEADTLAEVKRSLSNGGRFVVLPVAMLMGRGMLDRAMALLFRITHQSPVDPVEVVVQRLKQPFIEAGFQVEIKQVEVKSSLLLIVLADKG
jgi:ubiquinone/menaquinone biosynthesis C-methylase UbiE